MTLRTSCFDRGIFLKTVKRFWPLWAAYLLLWLFDLPISLHENYGYRTEVALTQVQRFILQNLSEDCVIITFLFAPLSAMAVFSHLYNDRSCGTYASLPLKRESMFLSVALAGILPLLLTHIIVFGATFGVAASLGHPVAAANLSWLCGSMMELVFFYGFAVLCAQLTGHILIVPAVYAVLNFTAYVVHMIMSLLYELFLYGYSNANDTVAAILTPVASLMRHVSWVTVSIEENAQGQTLAASYVLEGWDTLIVYAIAGLALLALSLVLYKKRRMETAGDVVAYRPLRPVFKYALASGCALVLGMLLAELFYNDTYRTIFGASRAVGICVCGILGGFIGYFGAEMLNRKTFRVFAAKKSWVGFGCFALAVALGIAALELDITGFETRIPDPEKIEYVQFHFSGDAIPFGAEDADSAIALHEKIIATRKADPASGWVGSRSVTVDYRMENGTLFHRRYNIPVCDDTRPLLQEAEDLMNSPAARAKKGFGVENLTPYWFQYCTVTAGDIQRSLDRDEAYAFYTQCVLPDLREGKLDRSWLLEDSIYRETAYNASIRLEIQEPVPENRKDDAVYGHLYLHPTTESHRINDWLTAHNVPLIPEDEEKLKYDGPAVVYETSEPVVTAAEVTRPG